MKKVLSTVFGLMCAAALAAQWNPAESLLVTPGEIMEFDARTGKDGRSFVGSCYMVSEDPERLGNRDSDGSDYAYYLQILDREGNKILPEKEKGLLISNEPSSSMNAGDAQRIFVDSDGNILYIVKDQRNATINGAINYGESFFIYKIDPDGQFLWQNPLDLGRGTVYAHAFDLKITQLSDGTYIVAHDVEVTGGNRMYTIIERVSKNGALLWNEPLILDDYSESVAIPYLVSAGYYFIVVYSKCVPPKLGQGRLYAEKFAFDKTPIWSAPADIYSGGFTTGQNPMTAVRVISDQKGGCFVSWYDDHTGSRYEKAYVSHILSNGTQAFVPSGSDEGLRLNWRPYARALRPSLAYDPDGENLYAAWEEDDTDQVYRNIVIQKVSKNSELLWEDPNSAEGNFNGLTIAEALAPGSVGYYSIQAAGEGKITLFYQHNYTAGGSVENIAVLFDVSGEQPREERRLVFTQKGRSRSSLISSPMQDNEYFLTFWHEAGAVYAQKVPASLLPPCEPASNIEASPAAGSATLAWTSDAHAFNVRFREAEAGAWTESKVTETNALTFNNLTPGTAYEYTIQAVCSEAPGDTSAWSPVYTCTTAAIPTCPAPIGLTVGNITSNSATLAWTAAPENTSWDLAYREAAAEAWTDTLGLPESSYQLTGLTANTVYLWQVKAHCGAIENGSSYAGPEQFNTIATALAAAAAGAWNVALAPQAVCILNPEGTYIDRVRIYTIDGRLIRDFDVRSSGNVFIPTAIPQKTAIVKITGKDTRAVFKVPVK